LAENAEKLFVARSTDVDFLREHLDASLEGQGRTVVLEAPLGGGKRALTGEFLRSLGDFDGLIWRAALIEEEEGMRALLRLYATLYAACTRDAMRKGRVEMILNAQLPSKPKRVQQWYQAFIQGLRKPPAPAEEGKQGVQVTLPRDNPVLGLVEIVRGIATKMPIVLEIQNLQCAQSVGLYGGLEALHEIGKESKLFQIWSIVDRSDENRAWMPMPLLDLLERRSEEMVSLKLEGWSADDVQSYLDSKGLSSNAAELSRLASGRPGYVAELVDLLGEQDKLGSDLSALSLAGLYPRDVDEDELEEGEGKNNRKHATAADLEDVAFRAALLGRAFPSSLVADVGGYDRDSIDDLLDAAGDLFEEMQFSKPMQTWIYQFKKASYRDGALAHAKANNPDHQQIARSTASFMERFLVPRAYDFVVKTARVYAIAGSPKQAAVLRSMAVSGDRPELWSMSHNLMAYFKDIEWPEAMRRTVYMNLMDRMAMQGDVNQAETLYTEIQAWADAREDRRLKGWLLFAGSRLDLRRRDYYRARDRAKDSLVLYGAIGDKLKVSELHNHMGMIELQDGNPTAAWSCADAALREGTIEQKQPDGEGRRAVLPQTAANAEFLRGLVRKHERKWSDAAEHFQRSNEIAGNTGQAALALESGINLGEVLLVGGDHAKAADILQRVLQIAGSLNNAMAQRRSATLLAQSQAALKNFDAALNWSKQTLQMSQQMKLEQFIPVDTYNVGLFTLMKGNNTEALALLRQAKSIANLQRDAHFAKELLFNLGVAALRVGETQEAANAFNQCRPAAQAAKDARKFVAASLNLGKILKAGGRSEDANKVFQEGMQAAESAGLKEERKALRKAMEA
jgi:tetratricopeptide (TPR) repeat protein